MDHRIKPTPEEELIRVDLLLADGDANDVRVRVQLEREWLQLAGIEDEESEAA